MESNKKEEKKEANETEESSESLDCEDNKEYEMYSPKYGHIELNSINFDDHPILGHKYLEFKPEKIIFWTNSTNGFTILTGIQTIYRSIIDKKEINTGENKGSNPLQDKTEILIKGIEYLTDFKIWKDDKYIYKVSLQTNKGTKFIVGEEKGEKFEPDFLKDNDKIILSFFGCFKENLESLGFHYKQRKEYMQILFTGYFELKAKLRKQKVKDEVMQKYEKNEYDENTKYLIKTCLLPKKTFNEVMKFCVL